MDPLARKLTRLAMSLTCLAFLGQAVPAQAGAELGTLTCTRIAGTGVNLLITSSAQVRCIFTGTGDAEQWYIGETGVKLGIDLKFGGQETLNFVVLAATGEFVPEGAFLSGKYRGGEASAALGLGVGAAVLVGGSSETIALQPAIETSTGAAGVSAGIGFLDIEPDPLNLARIVTPGGRVSQQILYAGYFDLAFGRYHQDPPDYAGSDYFSERAILAARGEGPQPESSSAWDMGQTNIKAAAEARKRLVMAQARNAGLTTTAANAQVAYDCWLFATANGLTARKASCEAQYETAVSAIETAVAEEDLESLVMHPMWQRVLFDTDVWELNGNESLALNAIRQRLAYLNKASIGVVGNADQPGTREYNLELSQKRAKAVSEALINAGVPPEWIRFDALGEDNPLPNNRYDALNRRVDIVLNPVAVNAAAVEAEVARSRAP